jgi:uncharacterized protein (TIGR00290 family)
MSIACVLWTGGKDSALALHRARAAGARIACLATFAPERPAFLAHPISIMRLQAQALGLEHVIVTVREPMEASYRDGIAALCAARGIDTLVTGDIDQVAGHPSWIRRCCDGLGVDVHTPLWGADRGALVDELLAAGFRVIFSLVKRPWLGPAWAGRELTADALAELRRCDQPGFDLCGENGEYHTMVLDGPGFAGAIHIAESSVAERDGMSYLDIRGAKLTPRAACSA